MEVRLKKNTIDYLLNALNRENEDIFLQLKLNEKSILDSAGYNFKIEEDLADVIRDWAMDKQQIVGFDEDYELTNEGEMLQEIIDKFYT
ncbi:hypothetical protein JM83_2925 [Gillisia sp. Hel_I_86]|uniref:hypothetical protein n=1 Tax=Gillisia sp. Hel_I_86 TaxID=1249981 RepID=UPI001199C615|nr:hypothetical protein [Gillisia sp. Hel_I_86]TVZ27857.1 hypothetical protein JM83_2925 [Gillisia sp. Hel_I_86]